ncbi:calcineurin-like phosphoesterase [Microthyrium microscopicum]|uniref:Calcineurin-like phosphoesterase n=1 Tax=Microthyrium microscopicum TaxID=703497 RepID=A0A6A6UNL4_9PEZI|nr:calcineurin-like phosphoesterase [Microthyrium microscopicum]
MMTIFLALIFVFSFFAEIAYSCEECAPTNKPVTQTRLVRRMQPGALNATSGPKSPLEWGQINFLQTTDTHGWLEGHLKEPNHGADWGDIVSFTKSMKKTASDLGVDLLLIDTGDLHDGAGLSDSTSPNGLVSLPLFEQIEYDLLTIGNHELYVTEIAYEHFNQFAKVYGERYVTSNVKILNPATNQFEYVGHPYRYFTTDQGLRIMAFGVLFDFTGNSNVSQITRAADLIQLQWFKDALNYSQPIDMFLVIGHNPIRTTESTSTMGIIYQAIRQTNPDTPITVFGGHTHIRDAFVYDNKAVGLESGRYCETLGWMAISGFDLDSYNATEDCERPKPTKEAIVVQTGPAAANLSLSKSDSSLRYARRYIDWNRLSFEYHAKGSQLAGFDTQQGVAVSAEIIALRQQQNLSTIYGCAPATYCVSCRPFGTEGNIFSLLADVLSLIVVNSTREAIPRLIFINTGSVRFDLTQGPFTLDDSYIVSPFKNAVRYIPEVSYDIATKVLGILNALPYIKKRDLETRDFGFEPLNLLDSQFSCENPSLPASGLHKRSLPVVKRDTKPSPGYTTTDDFGTDGDDTIHAKIPYYSKPNALQVNASFPTDGSVPETIDLVFLDFLAPNILSALSSLGANYSKSDIQNYMLPDFTTNNFLATYAKLKWQENINNCPLGNGVGT